MTFHRLLLPFLLIVAMAGCGTEDSGAPPAPASQPETQAPAPAEQAPVAPAETVAPEPVDPVAAETGQEPPAVAEQPAEAAPPAAPASWQYAAGKHYSQLTAAQGTSGGPGGVEVTEVFWYGCPHCFSFDPIIKRWQAEQPGDVRFVRLPVMWNPTNEIHARMYYAAEALDKIDEMHEAFFTAFHRDGKTLTREAEIREFFADFGISNEDFDAAFRSFTVESKLKRAKDLTARYRVRSVPVIVVDGKYIVDGPEVKSYADMLAVTDELVAKERIER